MVGGVWLNSWRRGPCFSLMELEGPSRGGALGRGATAGGGPFPELGDGVEAGESPLIPSLARASSLGLFFFRKL